MRRRFPLSMLLLAAHLVSSTAFAGKIYWSDRRAGKIERANLDGSEPETLATIDSTNLRGITIDVPDNRLYFADNQSDKIFRARLDGSEMEEIVTGLGFPADLKFDLTNRKLYWCDQQRNLVERANSDGSGIEEVISTIAPYYLDLDLAQNRFFWGGFGDGTINRANLDGSSRETIVDNLLLTRGVKIDFERGYLYWCDRRANKLQRRPIEGGDTEDILENLDTPHGLVLDPIARKAYICDTGTDGVGIGGQSIYRADIDLGGEVEEIAALNQPWDADLDLRTHNIAEWRTRFFRFERVEEDMEPEGDFDRDGHTQLLEYGLSSHPEREDIQPAFKVVMVTNTQNQSVPAFQYRRFSDAADLDYELEASADLKSWISNENGELKTAEPVVEDLGNGVERVTVALQEPSESSQYLRLRVLLKP